ncbi:hypothetical protein SLEP1_g7122 [Rubroshorea leprosula]|uniref:RINT1-like protein MAG2L n=1 Tax=Rubroshorea leprosula TaxID=152421 RepID=A0AAV5HXC5_9ROSI|nr:hypothetical protein SLEP1_g7122 [Rubroshorea leprosula]
MFSPKLSTSPISEDFDTRQRRLLQALKAMNDIEEVLVNLEKCQPQWQHLVQAVDARVDRTLSVLRPEVISEHRVLLASLGWPPKLITSKVENGGISGIPNPLILMHGDKRRSYSQSFQVLCSLQQFQARRELRKLKMLGKKEYEIGLWAIDELVSPIASRVEYHFLKWIDQPEFIFALVYRLTRDFLVGVSEILQPLIDRARLLSCSAREAWVSAMVHMLSMFLEKRVFPALAERYKDKEMKLEVISSWLHLVNLIVAFDKQMQSLLSSEAGLFLPDSERFEGLSQGISVLIIFCNKPDWLKIWAKIEFKSAWRKLKAELKDARAWLTNTKHRVDFNGSTESEKFLLSTREDYKAPMIADSALKIAWEMVDRCQTLPAILVRAKFIRSAVIRFFWSFFNVLVLHCKNAELSFNDPDDDAFVKVCGSINAAVYVESKLQEWSDDARFLMMRIAENDSNIQKRDGGTTDHCCFFGEEIRSLAEFETNWLTEILAVLLRQFEALIGTYIHNRKHCKQEQNLTISKVSAALELSVSDDIVEALDTLRSQLKVLQANLNLKDFLDMWRSVADGLDHFITTSILTGDVRFSSRGIRQFEADMQALFLVFQPFCACPEAFFPTIRDTLKLLTMNKEGIKHLQIALSGNKNEKCLNVFGVPHLSFDQVSKILKIMKFEDCS